MGDNAGDVVIDKDTFQNRLTSFLTEWRNDKRNNDVLFGGATSIAIVFGKTDEVVGFQKNNAFQYWLLGYEFPVTLILLTLEKTYIVTTKKKASYLEPLNSSKTPIELLLRGKDHDENMKLFDKCTEIIKSSGKKHGVLAKLQPIGPFVDEWKEAFNKTASDVEEVDVSNAISSVALSVKDEKELRSVRDGARASSKILSKFLYDEMSQILDEESKVTHKAFCDKVNDKIDDAKFMQNLKVSNSFDTGAIDWAYNPLIQSGGVYDLNLRRTQPDERNLRAGVIIASLGLRYQTYASLVTRTYLVDPSKSQESNYRFLLAVHESVIRDIKEGATASKIYEKAVNLVKTKKPNLEGHFLKIVGWGIGIEARDGSLVLNSKNSRTLKDGMTFSITTGFIDLENPEAKSVKDKTYALVISDTVRVAAGGEALVFTKDAGSDLDSVSFYFKESEDEKPEKTKPKKDSRVGAVAQSNVTKTRLRGERATNQDAEKEAARREHQKELHAKKQQEGLERFKSDTGALNGVEEKRFKRFESYKRDNQFPSKVKELIVCVDERASTVVVPVIGRPVPFHINTIKNASTNNEQGFTYLRLNFLSPGQGLGRKEDQSFEDPNAHFVRSLSFRSKDHERLAETARQITDLKKNSARREQERKDMEDVVEQDKLQEMRQRRPHRMEPVFFRPALEGKRLAGSVEIHQNGLRYHHPTGQRHDILFSNIKHLFFQPCDHEFIVIIHVHLVNPIVINKKKTKDIQFYREATEMAFDETGNRKRKHRYGDEEEFEAEQEERRKRTQLNREFKLFAERVSDAGRADNLSVDIPFRELGFHGVPARSNVLIQPTTDCLVQLIEGPFLVITLSEIEVVHLERVQFGLKNFDMVLMFHDFNKSPIHINTIPVENLDGVKDWLDSVDIPFSEGPLNLNWSAIMKTVTADPHAFFLEGGWHFLSTESDDEDGSDESEEESAFEMSDEEVGRLSEESSEDEGSDFDDDASDDEGEDEDELSEQGEDWDELDKKAAKKDRNSGLEAADAKSGKKRR
ncbi:MAG: FACT complex subunit spt16 [Chrysothrix sp. TS-e1954]|nr:MAG: FACT complex subunit spt16 [Chrysothrix sp. TS-e1954]